MRSLTSKHSRGNILRKIRETVYSLNDSRHGNTDNCVQYESNAREIYTYINMIK